MLYTCGSAAVCCGFSTIVYTSPSAISRQSAVFSTAQSMHPRVYRHDTAPRTTRGTLPRQDRRRGLARCQLPRQHRGGGSTRPATTPRIPCLASPSAVPIRHPPFMKLLATGHWPDAPACQRPNTQHAPQRAATANQCPPATGRRLLWRGPHQSPAPSARGLAVQAQGRPDGGGAQKGAIPCCLLGLLAMGVVTGGFIPYPFPRLLPGNG